MATDTIGDLTGKTAMMELKGFDAGSCRLYAKLELLNPSGSLKDRIALAMIEDAEQRGLLEKGDTIVEGTAGNTGISLVMIAVPRGYKVCCVIPDKMSKTKIRQLERLGAKVILTRSDVDSAHPEHFMNVSRALGEKPGHFFIDQFGNPANSLAHYATTGPEIFNQLDGQVDAFVAGVGTGGTITGVGKFLKEQNPDTDIVLADPEGSMLASLVDRSLAFEKQPWLSEGIGTDFLPPLFDPQVVDKVVRFDNQETAFYTHQLLHQTGLFAGPSTGGVLASALRYCRAQTGPKQVVMLVADTGQRYIDTIYNPDWLTEKGVSPQTVIRHHL